MRGRRLGVAYELPRNLPRDGCMAELSIHEAARTLGLSVDTVRRRIKAGTLLARKDGAGRYLVQVDEAAAAAPAEAGPVNQGQSELARVQAELAHAEELVAELRHQREQLERQLRDREQAERELRVLLGQAQRALPVPTHEYE